MLPTLMLLRVEDWRDPDRLIRFAHDPGFLPLASSPPKGTSNLQHAREIKITMKPCVATQAA